jgi:hypothetical protein
VICDQEASPAIHCEEGEQTTRAADHKFIDRDFSEWECGVLLRAFRSEESDSICQDGARFAAGRGLAASVISAGKDASKARTPFMFQGQRIVVSLREAGGHWRYDPDYR